MNVNNLKKWLKRNGFSFNEYEREVSDEYGTELISGIWIPSLDVDIATENGRYVVIDSYGFEEYETNKELYKALKEMRE
ncbi:hypothetical protein [Staphylococcus phage PT94]